MTIANARQLLRQTCAELSLPANTASILLQDLTKLTASELAIRYEEPLARKQIVKLNKYLGKLANNTPIAYLTGRSEFYGYEIEVNSDVLIPRPETEGLVDLVLKNLPKRTQQKPVQILEVGTGSGCIAVALGEELTKRNTHFHYMGIDISATAVKLTKHNLSKHQQKISQKLTEDLETEKDIFSIKHCRLTKIPENYLPEVLISNPPYISTSQYAKLDPSVKNYEPKLALEAGEEGMDVYREIFNFLADLEIKPQLYLEISPFAANQVQKLFAMLYETTEVKNDLFGQQRYLIAGI